LLLKLYLALRIFSMAFTFLFPNMISFAEDD